MNDSVKISRRAFAGGLALLGLGRASALAQGFAGLGENAEGFAAVVPGRTLCVSRRSRSASGISHRVVVRDGEPEGCHRHRLWRAVDAVSSGHAAGRAAAGLGQPADLDGPCRRDVARTPTAISETFARGGVGQAGVETKPFLAWIDSWEMRGLEACATPCWRRSTSRRRAPISYALRLDADRPLVLQGDAGYSRKSDRGQASYYYSQPFFKVTRPHHHRRQAGRGHGPCLAGPGMEQPAAGPGPDRMGLVLAASELGRKTDAVPAAPAGRPQRSVRQLDRARRPLRRNCLSRQQHHADRRDRRRRPQGADRMARRHSRPRPCDRNHGAECRRAGWAPAFPIGRARSALRAATPD